MAYILEVKNGANLEIIEAYLFYEEKRIGLSEEFLEHLDTYFERITVNPKTLSTKTKTISRSIYKAFPFLGCL